MPGLVPGIDVLSAAHPQDVDGRDRPGRDGTVSYLLSHYSGGGRNMTSCFADSATTSGGDCSFMLWIAQNRS